MRSCHAQSNLLDRQALAGDSTGLYRGYIGRYWDNGK